MDKDVAETKLRILREAIQSNVQGVHNARVKPRALLKRTPPLWLWGSLLIISFTYLAVPSLVVSRGKAPSSNAGVDGTKSPSVVTDIVIKAAAPLSIPARLNRAALPLAVKRIVIDPGHGGKQHGAISESGVSEKDITLDIALRLRRLLENGSLEVFMTREADETLALEKRVAFANTNNADLFISIHVNWMEPREIRPLETYYVGATNDPAVIKLAGIENRDSGYSLADYRRLLEKIYLDTRRDESHTLARTINTELYQSLSQLNPELENRGVKMAPFAVLVGTQMPAVLAEVSCLSNEDDVKLLTNADYREKIAQALLKGILSYANNLNGSEKKVADLWKKPTKLSALE